MLEPIRIRHMVPDLIRAGLTGTGPIMIEPMMIGTIMAEPIEMGRGACENRAFILEPIRAMHIGYVQVEPMSIGHLTREPIKIGPFMAEPTKTGAVIIEP